MARADYELQTIRDADIVSSNGTEYTINILWTDTGGGTDMVLGPSGVQISYENPNEKDKNSFVLPSKCTIPFLVQDATDKAFILLLATDYQEKDVWITVRESSGSGTLLWAGYVILDLKDEQDVSYPYEVTLTAVDGLAALKEKPYLREVNSETGAVPTFPYVRTDTFYNKGFQNIIGGVAAFKWISDLLYNTGMVLADDDTGGTTFLENYTIQTAVNSYNEGHPTPAADIDPLRYSQISMKNLYIPQKGNIVDVPNCYEVLEYICKSFGMRCVYWEHCFHFIEIDQYNTDEDAAGTASVPINIPTRTYGSTGAFVSNQNYIGSTSFTPYDLTLENVSAPGEGLQKLSGTIYSGLPAIKTINALSLAGIGENVYGGMPLFITGPAPMGAAYTWDTSGNEVLYIIWPGGQTAANVVWSTIEDAADTDGINFESYLSWKNTTTTDLTTKVMFMLVAKPSSQTHAFPFKVCARNTGSVDYSWNDWTSGFSPYVGTSASLRFSRASVTFPPSATIDQNIGVLAYSTANDPYCVSHNGMFPTDAAFTGSWDFSVITFTCYDSNSTKPMRGFDGALGAGNFGSSYSHGAITGYTTGTGTAYDGTLLSTLGKYEKITDYKYDYKNTLNDVSGTGQEYRGILRAVGDEVSSTEAIEIDVVNKNSFVYKSGNYFWSDGTTIKVSDDGSTWEFANADGKWTQPTYVWNAGTTQFDYTVGAYDKKLVVLTLENIINNQSVSLKQLNGTTALSETDKYYSGTTILKYMNPMAKLTDLDSNTYQLMRGTFDLLTDQWSTTMNQIFYEVPSETINIGTRSLTGELMRETQ